MAVVQDRQHALVAARAAAELAGRRRLAAAVAAAEVGLPQRAIAEGLQVSQPAVAKMLDRARRWPELWQRTPRQVALEYAAGELSREQMRKELAEWPWTFGRPDGPGGPAGEWAEEWVPGAWDELVRASMDGLVDDEDYGYVLDRRRES